MSAATTLCPTYSAFVSAFSNLVRQLLTETEASLAQWREKLLAAFDTNGQVIVDVIPELELIVLEFRLRRSDSAELSGAQG